MSFCGTIRMQDYWKMRGFNLHCLSLMHKLLDLGHGQEVDKTEAGDQFRLFQLTSEEREDFRKFAANLRWLLQENREAYSKEYGKHEHDGYRLLKLFEFVPDSEMKPVVETLERVARGEKPNEEDLGKAVDFLRRIGNRAEAAAEGSRGGCF
jgi:hypothetical protein